MNTFVICFLNTLERPIALGRRKPEGHRVLNRQSVESNRQGVKSNGQSVELSRQCIESSRQGVESSR